MNGHHPSELSEALRIAVERGHIERVVNLLKQGAPSVLDQEGQTPLHIAASAGHVQLVDALIQAGCDVTVQDFVSLIYPIKGGKTFLLGHSLHNFKPHQT